MIIYGKQLFLHILSNKKDIIKCVYLAKECDKAIFNQIIKANLEVKRADFKKAQALARGGNHQGFLAEVEDFVFCDISEVKKFDKIVILYGLSDVGNIGAIIRTAYALGMQAVVIVSKSVAMEGVIRTSSGAAYEIPICICKDGLSFINELKQSGFSVYSTASGGEDVKNIKFETKTALIMGSEGEGIPKKVISKSDKCIGICMKNSFDSLNVSAAFAIICYRIMNE
ncbi:23S rRNA (guanosine(2251)-2'-O)-methyltransferase RlmB [Campylobacter sp. RM12327]|uniref:23S rRNA (guanosine(2251)-2'-O)-methyltransferase RlmB n=1 Tax=Campylobacter sputorum TaxID=206 RepID=UPI000B78A2BF|nr:MULTISPECIES: 23S rRNA (guanosine(2251)-2'-O)-methyltransferase RlmB [Campylobacter]ASM40614.1 rRNA methyltransferase, TrmH family, group 3 [Campylobacter sputorum]MBE7357721.1 23S rRNA (guanosine(2251)-2'-O)-methyltransferase RlmB [Campylobacter sp. RM11302]MBF6668999.1 23S rRNA (guanosine(2251)-2'-O)-methyltransferase RlmB [Campylobacter sp. RM12327]MBF6673992.1 23S rRNA (guanosine(2251)-2'-O)-methyltransferase RlmB [Campylobacter sp. RM13538]MBF6675895.1 23S rRNA (guanosine(2251)-2'-O)-m